MRIAIVVALALALLAVPALAQQQQINSFIGSSDAVFTAGGAGFTFPILPDTDYNYAEIYSEGPDIASGGIDGVAANTRTITKSQDTGDDANTSPTVNIERMSFGAQISLGGMGGVASNTVTVTSQQT